MAAVGAAVAAVVVIAWVHAGHVLVVGMGHVGFRTLRELTRLGVPAVAGAFEYTTIAELPATLGMMQQLVESQADGWAHATDEVRRFYDAVQSRPVPPGALTSE